MSKHKQHAIRNKFASMPWVIGALLILSVVAFPLIFIGLEILEPTTEGWRILSQHDSSNLIDPEVLEMLPPELQAEYAPQEPGLWGRFIDTITYPDFHQTTLYKRSLYTLILLASVATLTLLIGITLAWLVTFRKFRGKALLTFLLALPITIPTYVMATSYRLLTADLQLSGSIYIRDQYGPEAMQACDHYWNFLLAIFVLTASFYPYVFLAARTAFASLSSDYLETAQSLGKSRFYTFRKITLPLARTAIIGGLMLVCLETLNEYGAMKILGIETLMTEIFRIRSGSNDLNSAIRVSGYIMLIVFILIALEVLIRGRRKYHISRSSTLLESAPVASRRAKTLIFGITIPVLILCFFLPLSELLRQAYHGLNRANISDYTGAIWDSISLASQASLLILILSIFLAYAQRRVPHFALTLINKFCSLGYAIPGAILGVAIISWVGHLLQNDATTGMIEAIFYSSTYGLIIAYTIRFLNIGINATESGFSKIPKYLDEASAQLGKSNLTSLLHIHLPLLKPSILAGFFILFIDVLKELPLTLIMQPLNTETLATQTYSLFASQEEYALGSIPALILIFTGVIGMLVVRYLLKTKSNLS